MKINGIDASWWTEARFGLFIHWGIYAVAGRHEWVKERERLSDERYQRYLAHFSPEDCETAAASQLKQKYPRIGRIAFGSDSRELRPAPNAHTSVEGQGALQRAPGMNSTPFRYRCEIETASGKVVSVQTTD